MITKDSTRLRPGVDPQPRECLRCFGELVRTDSTLREGFGFEVQCPHCQYTWTEPFSERRRTP